VAPIRSSDDNAQSFQQNTFSVIGNRFNIQPRLTSQTALRRFSTEVFDGGAGDTVGA
jgi:hypothetical protein